MGWTELFDVWFQFWYDTSTRYVELMKVQPPFLQGVGWSLRRYLEGKKAIDTVMDEMWRALRVPSIEELTRVHQRISLLETRLLALEPPKREGVVPSAHTEGHSRPHSAEESQKQHSVP